jgi:hypothetical protein
LMETAVEFFNNPYVSDGYKLARTGMWTIRPVEIDPKQVLYRFYGTNKARTPAEGANGGWWFEYEHFQTIKHFALRNGYPVSHAARLFAAILFEFNEVDAWVSCEVTKPLRAWKGRGKQIEATGKDTRDPPKGEKVTPMQSVLEVYQTFLPGVGGPGSIATSVLKVKDSGTL